MFPPMLGLFIATLGGTAVGIERQWSGHADGPTARFGGVRTFTMLGGVAGLCGWQWTNGLHTLAAILLLGSVLLIVAAYAAGSRDDIDATTEVAAIVVLSAGVLAGTGSYRLASAIIALQSLLLIEKSRLHAFVRRIDDVELRAAIHFGALALVVLPLLPPGPYGPLGGVRPHELWMLVLFFSGIGYLGHIARRMVGPAQGYVAAGLLGGLMSSTHVTWTFARMSRAEPALAMQLSAGAIASNAMLFPRVIVAATVLHAPLGPQLLSYLLLPALAAAAIATIGARRRPSMETPPLSQGNPLQLRSALRMALLFQAVLMIVHAAHEVWGSSGIFASAAALGLTDVDALTMSMARGASAAVATDTAARAISIGILSNTLLKACLAIVAGSPRFRLLTGASLLLIAASIALPLAAQEFSALWGIFRSGGA